MAKGPDEGGKLYVPFHDGETAEQKVGGTGCWVAESAPQVQLINA